MIEEKKHHGTAWFAAIVITFAVAALFWAYLQTERGEKQEYPEYTPTVLPTIPSWTPDPEERGKG